MTACNSSIPALFLALTLLGWPGATRAAEIHVAVASNFKPAMVTLARQFEQKTGHQVVLVFGATGKQYAQIHHGAPFDAFFAADAARPQRLETEGLARPGSRFTYAIGQLLLWSATPGYVDSQGDVLRTGDFRHLAIANPDHAPYGLAAQHVLQAQGLWEPLRGRLVLGENIAQTFQFIDSGNAELGFIARSQAIRPGQPLRGSFWVVPQHLYPPIEQQAVLLRDNAIAIAFLDFVRSDAAAQTIRSYGYVLP